MPDLLRRFVKIRSADFTEEGTVEVVASTDAAVDMGGYRERLSHAKGAIDWSSARSVLLNHKSGYVAGRINKVWLDGNQLRAELYIDEDAVFDSGVNVRKAVAEGYVQGISIGYSYDIDSAVLDRDQGLVDVPYWALREITITPTQADVDAHIGRSLESLFPTNSPRRGKESTMNKEQLLRMYPAKYRELVLSTWADGEDADKVIRAVNAAIERDTAANSRSTEDDDEKDDTRNDDEKDDDEQAGDERSRANAIRASRRLTIERSLATVARSNGLGDVDLSDEKKFPNMEDGVRELMKIKATREAEGQSLPPVGGGTRITNDAHDKVRDGITDALLHMGGHGDPEQRSNDLRRCSATELVRAWLQSRGINTGTMLDDDLNQFASRQNLTNLNLRDANQLAADFSATLGNGLNKLVIQGYQSFAPTASLWCRQRMVRDFKRVDMSTVVAGLLAAQEQDGASFKEIKLGEKSASGTLKLYGRTLRLTYQDWRNDDLGEFARLVSELGQIAAYSEDRRAYEVLLAQAWAAGLVTTGAAFWDGTNDRVKHDGLSKTVAALETRSITIGGEDVPMNPLAKYILVPPVRYAAAVAATGQSGGSEIVNANAGMGYQVIKTPWLANSGLPGSNADDYFVVAGNGDSLVNLKDQLFPEPVVRQVEPGFSPDMAFVVMHAYESVMANQNAIQKGDWA